MVLTPTVTLALLVVAAVVYKVGIWIEQSRKARKLQCASPPRPPASARLKLVSEGRTRSWRSLENLAPYGDTFQFRNGLVSNPFFFTWSPENLRAIVSGQFADFGIGKRPQQLAALFGEGVFNSDGKKWEHSRLTLKPQFSKEQISQVHMLEKHIPTLVAAVKSSQRYANKVNGAATANGDPLFRSPIAFDDVVLRYTIDTAMDFLVGENMGALQALVDRPDLDFDRGAVDWDADYPMDSLEGRRRFCHAFITVANDAHQRVIHPYTHWFNRDSRVLGRAIAIFHGYGSYYVQKALDADDKEREKHSHAFLYQITRTNRDQKFLLDQFLSLLLAARGTTSGWLIWTIWYLSRHPKELTKLRHEILADFGPGSADDVAAITLERLRSCRYLKAVLQESLRLSPSVPMNYRTARYDTTLPVGGGPDHDKPVFIPKGATVYFSTYLLHRRQATFGDDRLVWRPERWEGENGDRKPRAYEYLPFLGGPRVCIGQQYANTEAQYFIVRLLQHFDSIQPPPNSKPYVHRDGHENIEFKESTALFPADGLNIIIGGNYDSAKA